MEKLHTFTPDGDRYVFDLKVRTNARGWAQLDTAQDAWYFGNWINPTTREIITYAEGDITRTTCATDEEFVAEVQRACAWYLQNDGKRPGIDPGFSPDLKVAFERLGLAEWLHQESGS